MNRGETFAAAKTQLLFLGVNENERKQFAEALEWITWKRLARHCEYRIEFYEC